MLTYLVLEVKDTMLLKNDTKNPDFSKKGQNYCNPYRVQLLNLHYP